jgi:DNA-binding transcriptional LysR family regulator
LQSPRRINPSGRRHYIAIGAAVVGIPSMMPAATMLPPGIFDMAAPRGPSFDDSGLPVTAVLAGQGAGLLPAALAQSDIAAGRLVRLADVALLEDFAYYLVYPEGSRESPKVAAFRRWVLGSAAADLRTPDVALATH